MFKKIKYFVIASAILLVLATGCSSKQSTRNLSVADEASPSGTIQSDSKTPASYDGTTVDTNGAVPNMDVGNTDESGKKIIFTVNMNLEVADTALTMDDLTASAVALGGYVADSSFSQQDTASSGSITLRIPPDKLKEFTQEVGTLGKILHSEMSSQDVTDQYYDVQSRLTNAEAQETQLLAIMGQAVKIEDILAVRSELNSVQEEIEVLKGQIRLMDNQVGYSTVIISITQTVIPSSPEVDPNKGIVARWSFEYVWQSIQKGFTNSSSFTLNAIGAIFIVLSYLFIPLIVIGGVVVGTICIVRLITKRHNRKKKP